MYKEQGSSPSFLRETLEDVQTIKSSNYVETTMDEDQGSPPPPSFRETLEDVETVKSSDYAKYCFALTSPGLPLQFTMSKIEKEKHYQEILDATSIFRVTPFHEYSGYSGPWIENHWIESFMGRSIDEFGPYIPIFVH